MAQMLHDHCHLGTSSPPTSDRWEARFEGRHHYTPEISAKIGRGMTGKLNFSVLSDTSGPVVFKNQRGLVLIATSISERDTLLGMLGKTCYFVDFYHEDTGDVPSSGDILEVKMSAAMIEASDPNQNYWYVAVNLEDAESAAVWTP
jgi:hypothetical protein